MFTVGGLGGFMVRQDVASGPLSGADSVPGTADDTDTTKQSSLSIAEVTHGRRWAFVNVLNKLFGRPENKVRSESHVIIRHIVMHLYS